MKQKIINEIVQDMLPYLNNLQIEKLQMVLQHALFAVKVEADEQCKSENKQRDLVELFLAAKRIEGCSEKSLKYYKATIETMINSIGKEVNQIMTDDLRTYLTDYQKRKNSSRVTIDNIRRILSSFSLG